MIDREVLITTGYLLNSTSSTMNILKHRCAFLILSTIVIVTQSLVCPHRWSYYNERCWSLNSDQPMIWEKARDECARYGADLASIGNDREDAFIAALIDDDRAIRHDDRNFRLFDSTGSTLSNAEIDECFRKSANSALIGVAEVAPEGLATYRDCLEYCLESMRRYNFVCKSAMWYRDRKECILNNDNRANNIDFFTSTIGTNEAIDYYDNMCFAGISTTTTTTPQSTSSSVGSVSSSQSTTVSDVNKCFVKYPNSILVGYADRVVEFDRVTDCMTFCFNCTDCLGADNRACNAFMYFRDYKQCIMIAETRIDHPDAFSAGDDDEADYYEKLVNCTNVTSSSSIDEQSTNSSSSIDLCYFLQEYICLVSECSDQMIVDMMFVVDGSGSIGPLDFEHIRQFLASIVDLLEIAPNRSQVGMIQFSDQAHVEFHLRSYQTSDQIKAAIESAPWRNGRTRLGNALAYVLANELVCEQGDRPHVPNVVLVLTDGMSQDDPSTIAKQMHLLENTIYAIGITDAVNDDQLANIASSMSHVYKLGNFTDLDNQFRDQIMHHICGNNRSKSLPIIYRQKRSLSSSNSGSWLGMRRDGRGHLRWVDGSLTNYTNWAPIDYDDDESSIDRCATIYGSTQKWSLSPCTEARSFICALAPIISLNEKIEQDLSIFAKRRR